MGSSTATANAKQQLLVIAAALVLAVASGRRRPVHLLLYMHDITGGPEQTAVVLEETRELAVVGGTGRLRGAAGYVLWRTAKVYSEIHMALELDVHASVPVPANDDDDTSSSTTTSVVADAAE